MHARMVDIIQHSHGVSRCHSSHHTSAFHKRPTLLSVKYLGTYRLLVFTIHYSLHLDLLLSSPHFPHPPFSCSQRNIVPRIAEVSDTPHCFHNQLNATLLIICGSALRTLRLRPIDRPSATFRKGTTSASQIYVLVHKVDSATVPV